MPIVYGGLPVVETKIVLIPNFRIKNEYFFYICTEGIIGFMNECKGKPAAAKRAGFFCAQWWGPTLLSAGRCEDEAAKKNIPGFCEL